MLTSEFLHDMCLRHSVNNLKMGIASREREQQSDAIDDIKFLANIGDNESENGILKIE